VHETRLCRTVISGFSRHVEEICAILGYYAASSGNPISTFRDNASVHIFKGQEVQEEKFFLDFLAFEYGTDTLSRNVDIGLPLDAAYYLRRSQILSIVCADTDCDNVAKHCSGCTTCDNIKIVYVLSNWLIILVCSLQPSEEIAIISRNNVHWLVALMEWKYVLCELKSFI
jgi:hypothetical protein